MEELGRRAIRIEALESTLAERDQTVPSSRPPGRHPDPARGDEEDLAQTQTHLASTRETLTALENAHRATLNELSNTRMELDLTQHERSKIRTELLHAEEKLARLETDLVDTERRLTTR